MGFIWKTLFFELNETLLVGDPKQPFPDLPQISGFRTYHDIDPQKGTRNWTIPGRVTPQMR